MFTQQKTPTEGRGGEEHAQRTGGQQELGSGGNTGATRGESFAIRKPDGSTSVCSIGVLKRVPLRCKRDT